MQCQLLSFEDMSDEFVAYEILARGTCVSIHATHKQFTTGILIFSGYSFLLHTLDAVQSTIATLTMILVSVCGRPGSVLRMYDDDIRSTKWEEYLWEKWGLKKALVADIILTLIAVKNKLSCILPSTGWTLIADTWWRWPMHQVIMTKFDEIPGLVFG